MAHLGKLFVGLVLLICSACSSIGKDSQRSLYQELGGQEGLEQLVDVFILKIGNDEQIFPYFAKSNVTRFRESFITHICEVVDGPCRYEGDNMVDIHTGMNIDEADFNRLVELLISAMEENGIGYRTQNRLLARLAPMRSSIIHL